MKTSGFRYVLRPLALVALIAMLSACSFSATTPAASGTPGADAYTSATISRFQVGEVESFQGKRLDPAIGPSDNSISGIQTVNISTYRLTIDGLVDQQLSLTYDQVLALPAYQRLVTLDCVTGWSATILWKGVRIQDLLAKAGMTAVTKGGLSASALVVIFTGVDGYTTSLPLSTIEDMQIILAYSANGLQLPPATGYPFIVVAENKYGYKWARWVTKITLSNDTAYKGYWERQGYSNSGDIVG